MPTLYPSTRRGMTQEASWNARLSMFGAAATVATPAKSYPTVSEILRTYRFSRYEFRTLYASGKCVQASMLVQNPVDSADRFIVTAKATAVGLQWEVQCPRSRSAEGPAFIEAVQRHIEDAQQARRAEEEAEAAWERIDETKCYGYSRFAG